MGVGKILQAFPNDGTLVVHVQGPIDRLSVVVSWIKTLEGIQHSQAGVNEGRLSTGLTRTKLVNRGVSDDATQPGTKGRPFSETIESSKGGDEGVLNRVFGVFFALS